jgi:hypothetical protein
MFTSEVFQNEEWNSIFLLPVDQQYDEEYLQMIKIKFQMSQYSEACSLLSTDSEMEPLSRRSSSDLSTLKNKIFSEQFLKNGWQNKISKQKNELKQKYISILGNNNASQVGKPKNSQTLKICDFIRSEVNPSFNNNFHFKRNYMN